MQGYVAALGVRHGVPTPANDLLLRLVRDSEARGGGLPAVPAAVFAAEMRRAGVFPL